MDIGGSGIKGCLVDLEKGQLIGERLRIETPQPSLPDPVYGVVAQIVDTFGWTGRVGVTFPGVMKHGVAHTAANVDKSWIGTDVDAGLEQLIPGTVETLNDADAAGIAEMRYGAGRDKSGVVLMLTFGTGIGSALFVDGHLVPNTEFGHIQVDGEDGERRAVGGRPGARGPRATREWAQAGRPLPRRPRGRAVARPDHRRRRGEQEGAQVGAAAVHPHARRPGAAAERRRHRGRGPGRARAHRPLTRERPNG